MGPTGENAPTNDLFMMEAEKKQREMALSQGGTQEQQAKKKTMVTFEEYTRLSTLICGLIKQYEKEGQDAMLQSEIVDKLVRQIISEEGVGTNIARSEETAKKIKNCINHLINKEGVLMITQDAADKNKRLLALNINIDLAMLDLQGK